MGKTQFTILFFLLLSATLCAQNWSELDRFLDKHLSRFNLPGAAVAIVQGDSLVHTWTGGDWPGPNRPYYLGSPSKPFTAAAVLQLVDAGRLSIDDPVQKWLPELIFNGAQPEQMKVAHLLRHRSGLTRRQGLMPVPTLEALQERTFELTLYYAPRSREEYSNLNYVLLGLLIERVSGRSYAGYLRDSIFQPLDMDNSYCRRIVAGDQLMRGHQFWFGIPVESEQAGYKETAIPAGFIISSPQDVAHFLIAHLREGAYKDRQVLSSPHIRRLRHFADEDRSRVLNWRTGSWNGHSLLQSDGATATSYAYMVLLPKEDLGFVFMTNVNAYNPIANSVQGFPEGILNFLTGSEPGDYFPYNLIVLLAFGLVLALNLIALVRRGLSWVKAGAPMDSGESRNAMLKMIFWKLIVPVGVAWALLRYFDISLTNLLVLQPDMGWTIVVSIFAGFVAGFLEHFTSVKENTNT